mmetsp:Transcript_39573/g.79921  ORF Transcript_39573/g.79921 Transcript_39573/m.79921 type:complete len:453 (-) Transcript_39573:82-1440(-)
MATMTQVVAKTPQKTPVRDVDAVISARKAQLLSAKARNDQLYSSLSSRAAQRSATKTPLSATRVEKDNTENRPSSPSSPNLNRHMSEANSPWKNHLAMLKRAKEEADEAKLRESSALMQARQVNDSLLSSVQEQLNDMKADAEDAHEDLRTEISDSSETLRAKLEMRLADTVASVTARLEAQLAQRDQDTKAVRGEVSALDEKLTLATEAQHEALGAAVGTLASTVRGELVAAQSEAQGKLDDTCSRMASLEEVVAANSSVLAGMSRDTSEHLARTDLVHSQVRDHMGMIQTAISNHHRLAADLDSVEERLDGKVVEHMDKACTALQDQFVSLFKTSEQRTVERADNVDESLQRVLGEQLGARQSVDGLASSNASTLREVAAFKAEQTEKMEDVMRASAQMASDVQRAVSIATESAPASLRFSIALAAWVALLALVYACFLHVPADTSKVVY